ncbi:MAG TPA: hypothetical protein VHG09_15520 [Longimicrobiales bacterium]|nr:hypothetical protein [Longimicrobiales bacterium]
MDSQLRARAEGRLAEAAQAQGVADPRPPYRERLRRLRQSQPEAFDRAIQHYEQHVVPALAGSDPLSTWIDYGRFLAQLDGEGRTVHVDEQGRATPWTTDAPAGLVLFIPEEPASDVLVLCQPLESSDAQEATVRLLVERKLG